MDAEAVSVTALPEVSVRAWRDLAVHAAEPNPFYEPDFVLPAARYLRLGTPLLLLIWDRNRLLACLPIIRRAGVRGIPAPSVRSWRHPYSLLGTPLIDEARSSDAMNELLRLALRLCRGFRLLLIEWLGEGGPVSAALDDVLKAQGVQAARLRPFTRSVYYKPLDRVAAQDAFSHSHRRLRRLRRALQNAADHDVTIVDRSWDPSAPEAFLRLEASGWKGRQGTAMAARHGHARFFLEMCSRLSGAERLELLALEISGVPIAMKCSLHAGSGTFYFKTAYDERYAHFSPGALLELEAVDRFLSNDQPGWIDSCAAPDNVLVNRLFPDRRSISTVLVPPRGFHWAGRIARLVADRR